MQPTGAVTRGASDRSGRLQAADKTAEPEFNDEIPF